MKNVSWVALAVTAALLVSFLYNLHAAKDCSWRHCEHGEPTWLRFGVGCVCVERPR